MSDMERLKNTALRVARLAALNAPAIIIADQVNLLAKRTDALCQAVGTTLADERERNARLMAEIDAQGPLSAEEEEQFQAEQAAYDAAAEKAQKAAGYSDVEWGRLDHSYRFDLVMEHFVEPSH